MGTTSIIVVVAGSLATVVCVGWFLLARQHPESAATHADTPPTPQSGSEAESMNPDDIGGDHRTPRPT
jgi:hypothetical protein